MNDQFRSIRIWLKRIRGRISTDLCLASSTALAGLSIERKDKGGTLVQDVY
jgi:hypothetical protein